MKCIRKIASLTAAISLLSALTACENTNGEEENTAPSLTSATVTINTSEFSEDERDEISNAAENLLDGELSNKTLKWMANFDINPSVSGNSKSAQLTMFEDKYGGKIEYYPVTSETLYNELATAVLGGEGIDFVYRGNYIRGPVNGLFQPVDDYVDFDSELWKDMKNVNEKFVVGGKHYAMMTKVISGEVVIYNRKTIEEHGLDDPEELFKNGEWNWDTYKKMLSEFVDEDNDRHGIDGWWIDTPIYLSTGRALISLEDGKVTSNMRTPEMERAMNYLYELNKDGCLIDKSLFDWKTNEQFIGEGKELFYPCGLWILWREKSLWDTVFGEDVMFVPIPKDPSADKYYLPADFEGYMLCKGAQNPEGVIKFLECGLVVNQDERLQELERQRKLSDYGWREDMIEMEQLIDGMTKENPVPELYLDSSTDIKDLLDPAKQAASQGIEWSVTVGTYADTIDMLVDEINQKLAEQ